MNIKFVLNEIKIHQVIPRLVSPKFLKRLKEYVNREIKKYPEDSSFYQDFSNWLNGNVEDSNEYKRFIRRVEEGLDIDKTKKPIVMNWLISQFISGNIENSIMAEFFRFDTTTMEKFFQYQRFIEPPEKKDLMNVESWSELYFLVSRAYQKYNEWSKTNKSKQLKDKAEYRKIHEDEFFSIYIPENKEASCLLGMGTRWCTAAMTSQNFYNHYTQEGKEKLFILISKTDPNYKFQLSFAYHQFKNADDRTIGRDLLKWFLEKYHEVFLKYDRFQFSATLRNEVKLFMYIDLSVPNKKEIKKEIINDKGELYKLFYIQPHQTEFAYIPYYIPEWLYNIVGTKLDDSI